MYITTSRKPSQATRKLARVLTYFLNATYENRGKKPIDEIVSRSRKLGMNRILLVYEEHGEPCKLSFIKVTPRIWKWLEPEINFKHPRMPDIKKKSIGKEAIITGSKKERYKDLFDLPEPTTDDVVKINADKDKIVISYGKEKIILKLK